MSDDLELSESRDGEWLRLTLGGELTLSSAKGLDRRLEQLRADGTPVRLDLSQLEFLDSSGLTVLVRAMNASRETGWQFDIDRNVSPFVEHRFRHTGLAAILGWYWADRARQD